MSEQGDGMIMRPLAGIAVRLERGAGNRSEAGTLRVCGARANLPVPVWHGRRLTRIGDVRRHVHVCTLPPHDDTRLHCGTPLREGSAPHSVHSATFGPRADLAAMWDSVGTLVAQSAPGERLPFRGRRVAGMPDDVTGEPSGLEDGRARRYIMAVDPARPGALSVARSDFDGILRDVTPSRLLDDMMRGRDMLAPQDTIRAVQDALRRARATHHTLDAGQVSMTDGELRAAETDERKLPLSEQVTRAVMGAGVRAESRIYDELGRLARAEGVRFPAGDVATRVNDLLGAVRADAMDRHVAHTHEILDGLFGEFGHDDVPGTRTSRSELSGRPLRTAGVRERIRRFGRAQADRPSMPGREALASTLVDAMATHAPPPGQETWIGLARHLADAVIREHGGGRSTDAGEQAASSIGDGLTSRTRHVGPVGATYTLLNPTSATFTPLSEEEAVRAAMVGRKVGHAPVAATQHPETAPDGTPVADPPGPTDGGPAAHHYRERMRGALETIAAAGNGYLDPELAMAEGRLTENRPHDGGSVTFRRVRDEELPDVLDRFVERAVTWHGAAERQRRRAGRYQRALADLHAFLRRDIADPFKGAVADGVGGSDLVSKVRRAIRIGPAALGEADYAVADPDGPRTLPVPQGVEYDRMILNGQCQGCGAALHARHATLRDATTSGTLYCPNGCDPRATRWQRPASGPLATASLLGDGTVRLQPGPIPGWWPQVADPAEFTFTRDEGGPVRAPRFVGSMSTGDPHLSRRGLVPDPALPSEDDQHWTRTTLLYGKPPLQSLVEVVQAMADQSADQAVRSLRRVLLTLAGAISSTERLVGRRIPHAESLAGLPQHTVVGWRNAQGQVREVATAFRPVAMGPAPLAQPDVNAIRWAFSDGAQRYSVSSGELLKRPGVFAWVILACPDTEWPTMKEVP